MVPGNCVTVNSSPTLKLVRTRVGLCSSESGKRKDSTSFRNYADASNLRGGGFIEGVSPNIVAIRIEGDVLRYVGYSPDPGCVVMDLKRVEQSDPALKIYEACHLWFQQVSAPNLPRSRNTAKVP